MVESLAVLGIILSMIRPPQQVQPQYHYQHPAQQYYQPQQQVPYYVPQQPQGNYQYQSPQPVEVPTGHKQDRKDTTMDNRPKRQRTRQGVDKSWRREYNVE